jgi:sugar/nucleoside kinase (ribokinase family)
LLHYYALQVRGASRAAASVIAAVGELLLDVSIALDAELVPDDDRDARIRIGGGGQAANFCAWAASLGEPARLITRVGDDETGSRLVAELREAGVEVLAPVAAEPTGAVAVLVGPDGRRSFARQAGASRGLRPGDVVAAWLDGVALLHVSAYALYREPLAAAASRVAELARERGALLSVDLASAADLAAGGRERALGQLAGLRPDLLFATEREAEALAAPLEDLARVPVVKLGGRGCRVLGRRVPAPAVDVVDGTGAGDAFAAAFCLAYLEGAPPLEAAGRAVLVGSRACTKLGARP